MKPQKPLTPKQKQEREDARRLKTLRTRASVLEDEKGRQLPLSDRKTRVLILLMTYKDVCTSGRVELQVQTSRDKPSSRSPRRPAEFYEGSYKALERCLDALKASYRVDYFNLWRYYVEGVMGSGWTDEARREKGLERLLEWLPENIYVPEAFSESAGYGGEESKRASFKYKEKVA